MHERSLAKCLLLAACMLDGASARDEIVGRSRLLLNADGGNQKYAAVARLSASLACTAFLVDTGGSPDAPAYMVSNGHCFDLDANAVIVDRAPAPTVRVTFHYFQDTQDRQLVMPVRRIAYSTMKRMDLSILELDTTLGALAAKGVLPIVIAARPPEPGTIVESIGAPVDGVPLDEAFLRRSECALAPPVDLVEFTWRFDRESPNVCSDITGGSSGSPVFDKASGQVVGVMNTTTAGALHDSGDFLCYSGQPCEIVPGGGFRYRRETNYAVPVDGIPACFSPEGLFDLARAGCSLDPGRQLSIALSRRATRPRVPGPAGDPVPATWDAALSGDAWSWYRYKVVPEGRGSCWTAEGYGSSRRLSENAKIDDPLPETEGRYYLCVIGGEAESGGAWQDPRFATFVHLRVDASPPSGPIPYQIRFFPEQYWIEPIFQVPELSAYRYKIGETAPAPCADPTGYRNYLRIPVRVPRTAFNFCLIGLDDADNEKLLEIPLAGLQILPDGVTNGASLRPGPVAPQSTITLRGVNLSLQTEVADPPRETVAGVSASITDSAGARRPLLLSYVAEGQVNALLPDVRAGRATLELKGPAGSALTVVEIVESAPGLFTANQTGTGFPIGIAFRGSERIYACPPASDCALPIDFPGGDGEVRLTLYATGIPPANSGGARVAFANENLPAAIRPHPGSAAISEVDVRLPGDFPLKGFIPIRLLIGERESQTVYLRFR